jgi:hypothetical protein
MKRRGVSPATDAEKYFEMAIGFLEVVDRLEIPVQVVPDVIPRVTWIMNIFVCPNVGQKDLASVRRDVGKSVKYVADRVLHVELGQVEL